MTVFFGTFAGAPIWVYVFIAFIWGLRHVAKHEKLEIFESRWS